MKSIDKLLAISAIIVSVSALFVSVKQTQVFSAQKDASVWPYVSTGKSWGPDYFILSVSNKGVGPAIIKDVSYVTADTTFLAINDYAIFMRKEYGDSILQRVPFSYSNVEGEGTVIMAGETVEILKFQNVPNLLSFVKKLPNLEINIEYCSIYGKCWENRNNEIIEK